MLAISRSSELDGQAGQYMLSSNQDSVRTLAIWERDLDKTRGEGKTELGYLNENRNL